MELVALPFLNLLSRGVICVGSTSLFVRAEITGSGCTSGEALGNFKVIVAGGEFFLYLRFTVGTRENGVNKSKEMFREGSCGFGSLYLCKTCVC